jgi:hypothetical protein
LDKPLTGLGIQATLGSFRLYQQRTTSSFYTLSYRDSAGSNNSIFNSSQTPRPASIASVDPVDFGDQPITFAVSPGKTSSKGTVVQNLDAIPIPQIRVGDESPIRLLTGVAAQTQSQTQQHLLLGAEYYPSKMIGAPTAKGGGPSSRSPEERFFAFGLALERNQGAADPVSGAPGFNETIPAAVYRGRWGFAIKPVTSNHRISQAKQDTAVLSSQLDNQINTLNSKLNGPRGKGDSIRQTAAEKADFANFRNDLENVADRYGVNPANAEPYSKGASSQISVAQALRDLDDESSPMSKGGGLSTDVMAAQVGTMLRLKDCLSTFMSQPAEAARKSLFKNQPTIAVYTEFEGSYGLKQSQYFGRYRSIWSANVKLCLDPKNEDAAYVLLSYENGFSRAEPNLRCNDITLTFGFQL